ncbi:Kanadaptin, partial [Halocaridina rubra]
MDADTDKDEKHFHEETESNKKELHGEEQTLTLSSESDDNFKVPPDVNFKRPVFIKPAKKSTNVEEEAVKSSEDEAEVEEKHLTAGSEASSKSPAEQLLEKSIPVPYKEPTWSGLPKHEYSFEVLKNGIIVETISLNKPFLLIGRLAQCDIVMEHPSLSRFHCVIQYRAENADDQKEGFYAYDLGSTHGSFHNKHQMKPKTYYRLHVGHMLKFGGSSRILILQGPDEDEEPESKFTVTELKEQAAKRAEKVRRPETSELEEEDRDEKQNEEGLEEKRDVENEGIDWGMGEDAVEDDDDEGESSENPFATLNEELYLNDPKKTLRGWFEREGYDFPEYIAEDVSPGLFRCKV